MDVQSVVLTAGVTTPINTSGRFFMLVSAGAPLQVQFVKDRSTFRETGRNVEAGYVSFPGNWLDREDRFDGVRLLSATTQTVEIGISDRAADYRRVVGIFQIQQPNGITTTADAAVDTSAAIKLAANANRRKVIIQHVSGAGVVRVGDSAITDARGARLTANGSITLDTTAAIYARTETGAAVISLFEETRT